VILWISLIPLVTRISTKENVNVAFVAISFFEGKCAFIMNGPLLFFFGRQEKGITKKTLFWRANLCGTYP
jgi:hypothetical protein